MYSKYLLFLILGLIINNVGQAQSVTTVTSSMPTSNNAGIAVGLNDTIYVSSAGNYRIRKLDPSGTVSIFVGSGSSGSVDGTGTAATIQRVYDLEYSHTTGYLYFTQYSGGQVRKVSPAGVVTTLATVVGDGAAVAIGTNDTLYTYSMSSGALNRVDPSGTVTLLGTLPGGGTDLKFLNRDTLYLAGGSSQRIFQVSGVTGTYSTLAGSSTSGYTDATGSAAQFSWPTGVTIDGDGYLYVSEYWNNTIRRITKSGVVTTYAGSGTASTVDGTGTSASFNHPWGISINRNT